MLVGVQYDNAPLPNFCLENSVFHDFPFCLLLMMLFKKMYSQVENILLVGGSPLLHISILYVLISFSLCMGPKHHVGSDSNTLLTRHSLPLQNVRLS